MLSCRAVHPGGRLGPHPGRRQGSLEIARHHVFPRQGHYTHDWQLRPQYPEPDLTEDQIGDLLQFDREALCRCAAAGR